MHNHRQPQEAAKNNTFRTTILSEMALQKKSHMDSTQQGSFPLFTRVYLCSFGQDPAGQYFSVYQDVPPSIWPGPSRSVLPNSRINPEYGGLYIQVVVCTPRGLVIARFSRQEQICLRPDQTRKSRKVG